MPTNLRAVSSSALPALTYAVKRGAKIPMIMEDSDQTFLPFSLPDIGEEEISEVIDTLRSGWLTTGPKAKRFEEDFARYIASGVEAVAVN